MIASGKVNVKPLITHRFKLEETLKAFETARTGAGGAVKVMISCEWKADNWKSLGEKARELLPFYFTFWHFI